MKRTNAMVVVVFAVAAVATGVGYWWGGAEDSGQKTVSVAQPARKILYYRNPMGLPDTSPIPKKDSMGMDYVPVYEGGEESDGNQIASPFAASGQVKISIEKVQKLGVKTERAAMRMLDKTIRVVGRVEVDERHIHNIAPKFEGWIEKLHVKST
ncbi:MAG: efflux RND transporter periplasmic adaptor subunit, partial [Gallionellaceae bacterium]